jgi:hypothetical protein
MSDLRTAAQQALEAMGKWSIGYHVDAVELNDLIATLEAALEQPDRAPVAWLYPEGLEALQKGKCWTAYGTKQGDDCSIPVFAHLPRRETEQEPVAWIQRDHLQKAQREPFLCRVEPAQRLPDFVPLYAHPPRREWQGLTDTEIGMEYVKWDATPGASMADFARAIEAALKEKNK